MHIHVSKVKIKKRIRRDLGDLSSLMESMHDYGLMNPIVINGKHELVAGQRRLESALRLGWETIEAKVVTASAEAEKLGLEIQENLHRRDLTDDELADALKRLKKLQNPGFFQRLINALIAFFKKTFR